MTELPKRKKIRLPHHDYGENGAYFITVCTEDMRKVFGKKENNQILLNPYGVIADEEISKTNEIRCKYGIKITKYAIMPNHIHLLIEVDREEIVGTQRDVSAEGFAKPTSQTIPTVVRAYKSAVTKRINEMIGHGAPWPYKKNGEKAVVFQSRYFDRVIRNREEYLAAWKYIDENPYQQRKNSKSMQI